MFFWTFLTTPPTEFYDTPLYIVYIAGSTDLKVPVMFLITRKLIIQFFVQKA